MYARGGWAKIRVKLWLPIMRNAREVNENEEKYKLLKIDVGE